MTDIVERLRKPVPVCFSPTKMNSERKEAADEIERLRAGNEWLKQAITDTKLDVRAATIEECADEDMIAASLFASDGNGLFPLDATSLEIEAYTIRARDVCAAIRVLAKEQT